MITKLPDSVIDEVARILPDARFEVYDLGKYGQEVDLVLIESRGNVAVVHFYHRDGYRYDHIRSQMLEAAQKLADAPTIGT